MGKIDYKVFWSKRVGMHDEWFDGEESLGREMTAELLSRYGEDGWDVAATLQTMGCTYKIILKRRRADGAS